jgi:RNA ligase
MSNYLAQHFWNYDTNCIDGLKLWNALQPHIEKGELVVNIGQSKREGLKLVTYSKTYQYEHNSVSWDPLVQHCRGIIFDATDDYKIVALPFSKFFNYGEGNIHYPSQGATIDKVFEKVDGSLGICFYWRNKWHMTTRGSLNSDIGEVAQQMFDEMMKQQRMTLSPEHTRLFEIIYPENRICVDYGDVRELVFLGRRDTRSGEEDCEIGSAVWRSPLKYSFASNDEMVQWLNQQKGKDFEGFVVHFSDGSIFKFKSEDYMRLHRIIAQFTFKRVLEAVQLNQDEEIRKALPEELLPEFDRYKLMIDDKVCQIVTKVDKVVYNAPKDTRKEFALYLQQYHKGSDAMKYAFKYLDLDMNAFKLSDHVLQSLTKDDFEVDEQQTGDYN